MKNGLKRKIIRSHIGLSMALLIFITVLFIVLASFVSSQQARRSLISDASHLRNIVLSELESNPSLGSNQERIAFRQAIIEQFGSSELESHFAILTKDFKLLYPKKNLDASLESVILPEVSRKLTGEETSNLILTISTEGERFMVAVIPPKTTNVKAYRNYLILYTTVTSSANQLQTLFIVLSISLFISLVLAAVLGSVIGGSIASPILLLRERAQSLAKRDFTEGTPLHTEDEIEALSDSIEEMAEGLKHYDAAQKKFLQNASHELKTPLTSIQGYAEGIKDGVFPDTEKALDIIIEESVRLKGLVDELIYLTKLDSSEERFHFTRHSMNELLMNTCDKLQGFSVRMDRELDLKLSEDTTLFVDREKLQQALINIIGNSIKFGRTLVSIEGSIQKDFYVITVTDDGDGIDLPKLEDIFLRFEKGRKGDTGLGLSIAHLIIENHRGKIIASNNIAGGATFKVFLPLNGEA